MAKKKQLAGKQTKLAKLPLTQVLTSREDELAPRPASASPSPLAGPQAPLIGDPASQSAAAPLAAAYRFLVRELVVLRSRLEPTPDLSLPNFPSFVDSYPPQDSRLPQALRQARQGLRDLRRLLSNPC